MDAQGLPVTGAERRAERDGGFPAAELGDGRDVLSGVTQEILDMLQTNIEDLVMNGKTRLAPKDDFRLPSLQPHNGGDHWHGHAPAMRFAQMYLFE